MCLWEPWRSIWFALLFLSGARWGWGSGWVVPLGTVGRRSGWRRRLRLSLFVVVCCCLLLPAAVVCCCSLLSVGVFCYLLLLAVVCSCLFLSAVVVAVFVGSWLPVVGCWLLVVGLLVVGSCSCWLMAVVVSFCLSAVYPARPAAHTPKGRQVSKVLLSKF